MDRCHAIPEDIVMNLDIGAGEVIRCDSDFSGRIIKDIMMDVHVSGISLNLDTAPATEVRSAGEIVIMDFDVTGTIGPNTVVYLHGDLVVISFTVL